MLDINLSVFSALEKAAGKAAKNALFLQPLMQLCSQFAICYVSRREFLQHRCQRSAADHAGRLISYQSSPPVTTHSRPRRRSITLEGLALPRVAEALTFASLTAQLYLK